MLTEGRVQRGQGNGSPSTEKPVIVPQPLSQPEAVEALRELVEAMQEAFFGNATGLPTRVIQAFDSAHLFLYKLDLMAMAKPQPHGGRLVRGDVCPPPPREPQP